MREGGEDGEGGEGAADPIAPYGQPISPPFRAPKPPGAKLRYRSDPRTTFPTHRSRPVDPRTMTTRDDATAVESCVERWGIGHCAGCAS